MYTVGSFKSADEEGQEEGTMSKPKWPERPVYDGGEIFIAAVAGAYLVFKRAGANVITLGTKYVKEDAFALAENARNDSDDECSLCEEDN